jgi:hypothetical protein
MVMVVGDPADKFMRRLSDKIAEHHRRRAGEAW